MWIKIELRPHSLQLQKMGSRSAAPLVEMFEKNTPNKSKLVRELLSFIDLKYDDVSVEQYFARNNFTLELSKGWNFYCTNFKALIAAWEFAK